MTWKPYELDKAAHDLVANCPSDALNQAYKMRTAVAYGLERFWGEQLRLEGNKAKYWRDTWNKFVEIMGDAGITIPNDPIRPKSNREAIKKMADKLWGFSYPEQEITEEQRKILDQQRKVALSVLTQLCDCLIWWTQRYKD